MDRLFRRLVLEISAVWFWGSNRDRWVACGSLRAYDPKLCVEFACLLVCSACASLHDTLYRYFRLRMG